MLSYPNRDYFLSKIHKHTDYLRRHSWVLVYLSNTRQPVHHQGLLSIVIVVQVKHGDAERVNDAAAPGPFVSGIKGIHDDGLSSFYFTATEGAALAIRLLNKENKPTGSKQSRGVSKMLPKFVGHGWGRVVLRSTRVKQVARQQNIWWGLALNLPKSKISSKGA